MKKLIIDEQWYINLEDSNNCTLTFTEPREREKKTGEKEMYDYQQQFHYPNIPLCLKRYLIESQKEATTVQECIEITERVEALIKSKF